jgi:hypothetical protein
MNTDWMRIYLNYTRALYPFMFDSKWITFLALGKIDLRSYLILFSYISLYNVSAPQAILLRDKRYLEYRVACNFRFDCFPWDMREANSTDWNTSRTKSIRLSSSKV